MQKSLLIAALLLLATVNRGYAQTSVTDDGKKFKITEVAAVGGKLFAGTENNGVYASADSGTSWQTANNGLPPKTWIFYLLACGNNLVTVAYYNNELNQKKYISTDNGGSWKEIDIAGEARLSGFAVFKGKAFAATHTGLYQSADNGMTWTRTNAADKQEVKHVVATDDYVVFSMPDQRQGAYHPYVGYASTDGINWNEIKGELSIYDENLEAYGHNVIIRYCGSSFNKGDYHTCRGYRMSIMKKTRKGLKWEMVEPRPRYFGFAGDDIYAIDVTIEENKKKDFEYKREVLKSADHGETWVPVDEKTDSFVLADDRMQAKLAELSAWEEEEIQEWEVARNGLKLQRMDVIARKKEMKGSPGGDFHSYGPAIKTSSGPDYKALSNDRFKEKYNHRDSWIDSKGQIHTH